MSDGKTHDRIGLQIAFPYSLALLLLFFPRLQYVALGLLAYLASIYWISPDLDTKSNPFNRWGILKWYWEPYRRLVKHRSHSHVPIWGVIGQIAYLFAIPLLYAAFLALTEGITAIRPLGEFAILHKTAIGVVFSGLFTGAGVHIVLDLKPKKRRKKR